MGEDEQDEVDGKDVDATKATADVGESEKGDKVNEPDLEKVQKVTEPVAPETAAEKPADEAA